MRLCSRLVPLYRGALALLTIILYHIFVDLSRGIRKFFEKISKFHSGRTHCLIVSDVFDILRILDLPLSLLTYILYHIITNLSIWQIAQTFAPELPITIQSAQSARAVLVKYLTIIPESKSTIAIFWQPRHFVTYTKLRYTK